MARHDGIAGLFDSGIFFADIACPCQRGTNENSNGLRRQYLPKGRDLLAYPSEILGKSRIDRTTDRDRPSTGSRRRRSSLEF